MFLIYIIIIMCFKVEKKTKLDRKFLIEMHRKLIAIHCITFCVLTRCNNMVHSKCMYGMNGYRNFRF